MNNKKIIISILVLGLAGLFIYLLTRPSIPVEEVIITESPEIIIGTEEIKEENFTGRKPTISGDSALAIAARAHVEQRVAEFKVQADADVPAIRRDFGSDSSITKYTIDLRGEFLRADKIDTIVLSEYSYTGGANGHSAYRVINAMRIDSRILNLEEIIQEDAKDAFTDFVKSELQKWRPEGSEGPVVFEEVVNGLTFFSFKNWSLDSENLYLYFDKYEIGPGVLGATVFPLVMEDIKKFLKTDYVSATSGTSVRGCYVARLGPDVYSLNISSQTGEEVIGTLVFKNFQKDSSSGLFRGTYKDGILFGEYSFRSEGMDSLIEVVFKKVDDGFVRGFGPLSPEGDSFVDRNSIVYDSTYTFKAESGKCVTSL